MTSPAAIESQAAAMRADAVYADGLAFVQDMERAAELETRAAVMRRAALPLADRCRPVQMIPVRTESEWSRTYRLAIERAEAAGDHVAAERNRAMRDNHSRANPGLYAERINWRTA